MMSPSQSSCKVTLLTFTLVLQQCFPLLNPKLCDSGHGLEPVKTNYMSYCIDMCKSCLGLYFPYVGLPCAESLDAWLFPVWQLLRDIWHCIILTVPPRLLMTGQCMQGQIEPLLLFFAVHLFVWGSFSCYPKMAVSWLRDLWAIWCWWIQVSSFLVTGITIVLLRYKGSL